MPVALWWALGGAGLGGVVGFTAGEGVSSTATIVKYGVGGFALYLAAKAFKVI